jgi:lysophospholipase L1-like esterase
MKPILRILLVLLPVVAAAQFLMRSHRFAPSIPYDTFTDLETWSGSANQVISDARPFVSTDYSTRDRYVVITGGSGWTTGIYGVANHQSFGGDEMLQLDIAPHGSAGATGGLGHLFYGQGASNLVVCEGDSITQALSGRAAYPIYLQKGMGLTWYVINDAISGQTASTMNTNYAADVAPLYDATKARNVLVIFAGTNDINAGATASAAFNSVKNIGQAGIATGYQVFILTMLPRSGGAPGDFETKRTAFNTTLRGHFNVATGNARVFESGSGGTYANGLVDIAANTTIGDSGDELNATYYFDEVHLTNTGSDLLDDDVKYAIDNISATGAPEEEGGPTANVLAWWKADSIGGLSDGDPVDQWDDSHTTNEDLTGSSTARPLFQTNELNGLPVVEFDGSNDIMGATITHTGTNACTVISVITHVTVTTADRVGCFAKASITDYGSASTGLMAYIQTSVNSAYRNNALLSTITRPSNGTFFIYTVKWDGTNNTVYKNGVAGTAVASTGNFDFTHVYVGGGWSGGGNADFGNIKVAEMIIFNDDLSDADRGEWETYLDTKWAIP